MSTKLDLPKECWEEVIKFLTYRYLEPLSLVSKQFLSISDHLRTCLSITDQTLLSCLPRLFTRFPNVQSLDVTRFGGDVNALLHQISESSSWSLSSLNISNHKTIPADGLRALAQTKMKTTLKCLICSNMGFLSIADLILIADCFPFLEELDISKPGGGFTSPSPIMSDAGMEALFLALPKLRKVNLSQNHFFTNSSLSTLCNYCEFLEEMEIYMCEFITQYGIASALITATNLMSFSFCDYLRERIPLDLISSLTSLKRLTSIELSFVHISDAFLFHVAQAGLPLRKLVLHCCHDYSFDGIFCLLSECRRVKHLDFGWTEFLKDEHLIKLSGFLGNLMFINLRGCKLLTNSTFFALTRGCPLLGEINMGATSIGEHGIGNGVEDSLVDYVLNSQMKSLRLSHNSNLRDESIEIFASICPNLQLLELESCDCLSRGIIEVLKRCPKISHLILSHHSDVKSFGLIKFQVPKLEVLDLSGSLIDDETLFTISETCCGLLDLNLEACSKITAEGVKQVVKRCKKLREINLFSCYNVDTDVVALMVSSRPSLRRVVAPPSSHLSESLRKSFLQNGCLVS